MTTELRKFEFKFTENFELPLSALLSQVEFSTIHIDAQEVDNIWIKIKAKSDSITELQFMSDLVKVGKVLGNISAFQQQFA